VDFSVNNDNIYFVYCNGERKQESFKNVKVFTDCGFMSISLTSIRGPLVNRAIWQRCFSIFSLSEKGE
jgi:hypothetical protein